MEGFSHVVQHGRGVPTGLGPYTEHRFGLIYSLGEEPPGLTVYFMVCLSSCKAGCCNCKRDLPKLESCCGQPREVIPSLHTSISLGPAQHRRLGGALKASVPCMKLHGDPSTKSWGSCQ